MIADAKILADYVTFARASQEANDIEPWAAVLKQLWDSGELPEEEAAWITVLYNTYDDLGSACAVYARWPTPQAWAGAEDRDDAADGKLYPRAQERRNLHGLSVLKRHSGYVAELGVGTQLEWFSEPLQLDSEGADFKRMMAHVQKVWGIGRQAAFEMCEFAGKVFGLPVDAADGELWESSGPRASFESIYGLDKPNANLLNYVAEETKDHLRDEGVDLPWVDLETTICDFHVMRKGRYFTGRHLTMLKSEIESVKDPSLAELLGACFGAVVPEPWSSIPSGLGSDQPLRSLYQRTGKVITEPWW